MDNAKKIVEIIPPRDTKEQSKPLSQRRLRVAAYCRVSSDSEEQLNSYKSQIEYYTAKIKENPNWFNVRIFADKGLSGTTANRPEFQKLLRLAKRKKVDLIIVKSISRFSRNIEDCIKITRDLRGKGIGVFFEKENINTEEMDDETIFTVLSSMAQGESISMSKNIHKGYVQAFQAGKVHFNFSILGYRKGADGQPEIVPEEAQIVKRIYTRFLAGHSYRRIARDLEANGIPCKSGRSCWRGAVIKAILENERYTGDAICQKTYIENPLTHKARKNINELPKYLVMNNHPGIIDHGTYQQVQQEIVNRSGKGISVKSKTNISPDSNRNALTGRLVCGKCGSSLRRTKFREEFVWRCLGRMEYGVNFCPESETVYEKELHTAIMAAIHEVINRDELNAIINLGLAADERGDSLEALNQMSNQIFNQMMDIMARLIEAGGERDTPELRKLHVQREEILRKIERKKAEEPPTGNEIWMMRLRQ